MKWNGPLFPRSPSSHLPTPTINRTTQRFITIALAKFDIISKAELLSVSGIIPLSLLQVTAEINHVQEVFRFIRDSEFDTKLLPFQMSSLQMCPEAASSIDRSKSSND